MKTLEQNVPGIHRSILTKMVLLILFIFIVGCSHLPDSMPAMDFATENLNLKLQLSAPPAWNNYDANNRVSLLIQNLSNDQVVFPKDFNIRIYT